MILQGLLLDLYSEIIHGGAQGTIPYAMSAIESGSIACRTCTLHSVLYLWSLIKIFVSDNPKYCREGLQDTVIQ